jgi:hypothetical protein
MRFKCRVVAEYKANLLKWCDIPEMAKKLGNPLYYEVKQPDEEASRRMQEWYFQRWFHCYTRGCSAFGFVGYLLLWHGEAGIQE